MANRNIKQYPKTRLLRFTEQQDSWLAIVQAEGTSVGEFIRQLTQEQIDAHTASERTEAA